MANDHQFEFSVIIPTYNRREILEQTLYALEHQTMDKDLFEVIVVDDGSTDDTPDFIERYKNRAKLHFTYMSKKNEGQGIARNRGFEVSDGNIIVFIGDDMIPLPDMLDEHQIVHKKFHTENFICLGHVDWHPNIEVNAYMKFLEQSGMQFKFGALEKSKLIDPVLDLKLASYKNFYTSNISIKRSLFEKQQFDERFKKYGWEDIELGRRLEHSEGAVILYHSKSKVLHHHQIEDSEIEKRMTQIGKNAVRAQKINKTMKMVPPIWMRMGYWFWLYNPIAFKVIETLKNRELQSKPTKELGRFQYLYYYALTKKFFFKGVSSARRKRK